MRLNAQPGAVTETMRESQEGDSDGRGNGKVVDVKKEQGPMQAGKAPICYRVINGDVEGILFFVER